MDINYAYPATSSPLSTPRLPKTKRQCTHPKIQLDGEFILELRRYKKIIDHGLSRMSRMRVLIQQTERPHL